MFNADKLFVYVSNMNLRLLVCDQPLVSSLPWDFIDICEVIKGPQMDAIFISKDHSLDNLYHLLINIREI